LEGNPIHFGLEKTGGRSTNRIDETKMPHENNIAYIAKQTFADKNIPSSDKKQLKFILQKGVAIGGGNGKKVIHKFELK
jgi:hypothetical protein